jgi:hypothetical protein
LPLDGKVHSGPHYLEEPEEPAKPPATPLERAVDVFVKSVEEEYAGEIDPVLVERADDEDFLVNLADDVAPLTEIIGLPLTPDNKVCCPCSILRPLLRLPGLPEWRPGLS